MILYIILLVLTCTPGLTRVHMHGVCAPSSCTGTSAARTTSVVLRTTITRDPPYACREEELTFNCDVLNGVILQWVSKPDIPCDHSFSFTTGHVVGETRENDLYQSHLVSVSRAPPNSNFSSNLTFAPPQSVNSVTVHCGNELSLCSSTEDEYTLNITGAPVVSQSSLQVTNYNQERCPNVSVTIEIEEIQDVAPLTYKLNVSSSDSCVLQECPMLVSPGVRILNMTLMDGVNYTAMLTVSNDCGSDSTTTSIHHACEARATDPPPETPANSITIGGAVVVGAVGGLVVGALAGGAICVAVCIVYYRKKKKVKKSEYTVQELEEQRRHQTEKDEMQAKHDKEHQTLEGDHQRRLQEVQDKMQAKHNKEHQTLEGDHQRRLQEVQDEMQAKHHKERQKLEDNHQRKVQELQDEMSLMKEEHEKELQTLKEKMKKLHQRKKKRFRNRRQHITMQGNALHMAVMQGDLDQVRHLVEKGADVNIKDDTEMTSLHMAVEGAYIDIVKYLVYKGAHVNSKDYNGRTPLHIAVEEGQGCTVKFLIDSGAEVIIKDNDGMTPFHVAAERGRCEEILGYLLGKCDNINIKDDDGMTPLHVAVEEGQDCTVESLLDNGADIDNKDNEGMTPLHVAAARGDHINIVKYLIHQRADINIKDHMGWTPMHTAAREGHEYTVRTLVKKGAVINIKDHAGRTPQDVAKERSHLNIVNFLAEKRNHVNIPEFPRGVCMSERFNVWENGNIVHMKVCQENETMCDLQGTFEFDSNNIVALHLKKISR